VNNKILWIVLGLLVVLGAGLGFFWPFQASSVLRLAGMVEIQEVRLGSKVSGRVAEVLVQEGQQVSSGTRLVVFEVPELQALRDQLQARLMQAQADYFRVVNGARPEEKQAAQAAANAALARFEKLKYGWRDEEKKEVASEVETAKADFQQAEKELERVSQLIRQKSASQSDLDSAVAARDRMKGRLNAVQARHQMMQAGSRKEDIAEAQAEYEKAQARANELRAGNRWEDIAQAQARIMEAKAKVEEVEAQLREAEVLAPENVVIDVVAVRKGDIIPPNQPVIRALRAEDLWVKVFVPEIQLGKIRTDQEVEVFIDSYPNDPLRGRIIHIDPISEFTPRNVQSIEERRHQVFGVKVLVENNRGIFKAGMAAEVRIPLHTSP
jgi:HlyD family secretion protein